MQTLALNKPLHPIWTAIDCHEETDAYHASRFIADATACNNEQAHLLISQFMAV